jgi:hypothetical protein
MTAKNNDIFKRKKVKQEDFLTALDNISKKLIYKFKFGYHEIEDMKQQAAIFALEGLENYDSSRPLENFLWTHVRNRLFNFKRDNYFRPDNVCVGCPFHDPKNLKSTNQCAKYENKNDCSIYSQWQNRNSIKRGLMKPTNIDNEQVNSLKTSQDISLNISNNELIKIIEDNLETKYRETYLRLKGGAKISKQDLLKLQDHIQHILHKNNLNDEL